MTRRVVVVVTGSSGRLGTALRQRFPEGFGFDPVPGPWTTHTDLDALFGAVERETAAEGGEVIVFHAGALHKPDLARFSTVDFVERNVACTARLLQWAVGLQRAVLRRFVFTSTTSVFGDLFAAASETVWIDDRTVPRPKNVYGWSKVAAEQLIQLFATRTVERECRFVVLRACRFFPEADDRETAHDGLSEDNLKFVHVLNGRRLLLEDVVDAHVAASSVALPHFAVLNLGNAVCFERGRDDRDHLLALPFVGAVMAAKQWRLPARFDRVYDATATFQFLGWRPRHTAEVVAKRLLCGEAVEW